MSDPLFTPLELKSTSLKNRLVMGSLHTGLEDLPFGSFKRMASFYQKRAEGGVGLIVTGGVSPNFKGRLHFLGKQFTYWWQVYAHKKMVKKVHQAGAKICLQILHAGRYAHHPFCVAPSAIKAPINKYTPKEMSISEIESTINDFVHTAKLSEKAGYDGIEVMGSEGYLVNEFLALRSNKREDEWGGSFKNRMKFPLEIVKRIRSHTKKDFMIIYRISLLDLVEEGNTWDEIIELAQELEKAGVDLFDSGIGWHEARIPTIATMVPRKAFIKLTQRLKESVNIPVMATNRINMPDIARDILSNNQADLISMARPWLADENWGVKAQNKQDDEINTCIACNQACLDHIFQGKIASCLVNPKACFEDDFKKMPVKKLKVGIVGAGPAGLSAGIEAAKLGHNVTIYEKASEIGGQFNIAKEIPGKEEFKETIRYFKAMLKKYNIHLELNKKATKEDIIRENFDEVIISTGVKPFTPKIPGVDLSHVFSYPEAVKKVDSMIGNVALIGAGGIGFDMATLLTKKENQKAEEFFNEWGIDQTVQAQGGLKEKQTHKINRSIFLLQRKESKFGKSLGKTTGWAHRMELKKVGVQMIGGVQYKKIEPGKLTIETKEGEQELNVDHIIICAGQRSVNELYDELKDKISVHLIGGALKAAEIDAKRAIDEGIRLVHSF